MGGGMDGWGRGECLVPSTALDIHGESWNLFPVGTVGLTTPRDHTTRVLNHTQWPFSGLKDQLPWPG